jgi:hypothetical protein
VSENVQHLVILGQDQGHETGYSVFPGRLGQGHQERRGDPLMLAVVGHHEGHFGLGCARAPVVAAHRYQSVPVLGDEGQPVDLVDTGETFDLAG